MYDPKYTESFYDAYAGLEWSRMEATAYGRLKAIIHDDFIKRYIKAGNRVLDAGSGPGRFSISMAKLGARVTVLDISGNQLKLAREKIQAENLLDKIELFVKADISSLPMFPDGYFDAVICCGIILVSVMSRLGAMLNVARLPYLSILKKPDESTTDGSGLWQVFENGNLTGAPSRRTGMMHAPMHLYTTDELQRLFADCKVLEVAGSNVVAPEFSQALDEIAKEPQAWSTLVELERKINSNPGLVDSGTHIILAVRR